VARRTSVTPRRSERQLSLQTACWRKASPLLRSSTTTRLGGETNFSNPETAHVRLGEVPLWCLVGQPERQSTKALIHPFGRRFQAVKHTLHILSLPPGWLGWSRRGRRSIPTPTRSDSSLSIRRWSRRPSRATVSGRFPVAVRRVSQLTLNVAPRTVVESTVSKQVSGLCAMNELTAAA